MIQSNRKRVAGWSRITLSWGAALGTGIAMVSCKRAGEKMEITETREVSKFAPPSNAGMSTPERFGERSPLTWQVPEGWSDAGPDPTGGMRLINLKFGPN